MQMIIDERCVICASGIGVDVEHVGNLRGTGGYWRMR